MDVVFAVLDVVVAGATVAHTEQVVMLPSSTKAPGTASSPALTSLSSVRPVVGVIDVVIVIEVAGTRHGLIDVVDADLVVVVAVIDVVV
jgi:hypothetical protein